MVIIPIVTPRPKILIVVTYRMSTDFEAVMSYLHMTENLERLESLILWVPSKAENYQDMIAKELQTWFSAGLRFSDQPVREGYLALPLASQQWILLGNWAQWREKQLVALFDQREQARSLNPWYSYLIEGKGQAPKTLKRFSWFICHLSLFSAESGFLGWIWWTLSSRQWSQTQDYIFVLQQDKYTSVRAI